MPDNIGQVVIPAPVVQLKDTQFIENGVIVPQTIEVPCIQVNIDYSLYWAIPTKDNGIFTGWWYQPASTETGSAIAQPTYDSFQVLRIRDKISDYTWWIAATLTQYTGACNTCCGDDFTPIPPFAPPVIAPCQLICDAINDDGNYFVVFAATDLGAGEEYIVNGSFDNEAISEFSASDLDNLITELNTNFTDVGDASPPYEIIWTRNGNTIIGTLQNGQGQGSNLCLLIDAQNI